MVLMQFRVWTGCAVILLGLSYGFAVEDGANRGGTKADYERAGGLRKASSGKVLNERVNVQWSDGEETLRYRLRLPGGEEKWVMRDAVTGEEVSRDEADVPGESAKGADAKKFSGKGRQSSKKSDRLRQAPLRANATSPDGKWEVRVRDHNLVLREVKSGEKTVMSSAGHSEDSYARDVKWDETVEAELAKETESGGRPEVYWAPDSGGFVAMKRKRGTGRRVHLVESSPKDELQPQLSSYAYLKPGDELPYRTPHLFDVKSKGEVTLSGGDEFDNPWRITPLLWQGGRLYLLYNQRGHQALRLLAIEASSGDVKRVVDEVSETFIDYSQKHQFRILSKSGELIWSSERDGWHHLYLFDLATGRLKHQVTKGEWVVRGVERVDEEKREIWFWAGGIIPGQDPYHRHLCRVNFDGSDLVVLTEGDGTHEVIFSPDGKTFVDRWSRVDLAPVYELRDAGTGVLLAELSRADASALPGSRPMRLSAKGRDGKTDIYGVIHRPTNFDPARKYPVIEKIYAGPHGAFVPKGFSAYHGAQSLAELGFVVVQIDGMGTSHRSKAFHDVAWQNLADAGFPDRKAWLREAARRYEWMDIGRVGIYGGSAGGQSALGALLWHPNFYDVAVADCGCHDNRMDKIWWNEAWMGWPIGPHYEEQSNVTQAHRLQGKLMLTLGELDRNVDPSSTLQVVDALIKANKDFDFVLVPGAGHGVGEQPYMARRRADFFVRNLMGVEPRR
jgi:dipeptidyl-peptidase-4